MVRHIAPAFADSRLLLSCCALLCCRALRASMRLAYLCGFAAYWLLRVGVVAMPFAVPRVSLGVPVSSVPAGLLLGCVLALCRLPGRLALLLVRAGVQRE